MLSRRDRSKVIVRDDADLEQCLSNRLYHVLNENVPILSSDSFLLCGKESMADVCVNEPRSGDMIVARVSERTAGPKQVEKHAPAARVQRSVRRISGQSNLSEKITPSSCQNKMRSHVMEAAIVVQFNVALEKKRNAYPPMQP